MVKHIMITVVIAVMLSALALGVVLKRSDSASQAQQRPDIRSESLRTQAQKRGSATSAARPTNLRRYDTVDALARDSAAIVVGSVESKASQFLAPAEKMIVTDFQIRVRDALKGISAPGQAISVRTPGGRVDLGDGKYAEVKMSDFWKYPEVGKLYVFFLESRTNGTFVLRGGPQGLFEVTPAGSIKTQVRTEDKLKQNYEGKNLTAVVAEIRKATK